MDDDIIRMAQEAQQEQLSVDGRSPSTTLNGYWFSMEVADLARSAALVAAAEREACAKVCETHTVDDVLVGVGIAQSCAAAIRARAQQPDAAIADRLARHGIPMPGDPK